MGHWSIPRSVDYMDEHSNYELSLPYEEATAAAVAALSEEGRVAIDAAGSDGLVARTVKHTPAWAWVAWPLVLFVRLERRCEIAVEPSARGTVLKLRGKLDTVAAGRLRALRVT